MNQPFMTRPDEALAVHESIYGHNTSFVSLDDGRILQVCLGGGFVHSEDGGITWSEPGKEDVRLPSGGMIRCQCRDTNGDPVGGSECSLVRLSGKNQIGLAARLPDVVEGQTYATRTVERKLLFWRSDDAGETWEAPVRMTAPGCTRPVTRIRFCAPPAAASCCPCSTGSARKPLGGMHTPIR